MFHGSELELLFGHFPAVEQAFAEQMADFYINFINDLNPGGMLRIYDRLLRQCSLTRASPLAAVHSADQAGATADEGQYYCHPRRYATKVVLEGPS